MMVYILLFVYEESILDSFKYSNFVFGINIVKQLDDNEGSSLNIESYFTIYGTVLFFSIY